jgi:hypothetical protein
MIWLSGTWYRIFGRHLPVINVISISILGFGHCPMGRFGVNFLKIKMQIDKKIPVM